MCHSDLQFVLVYFFFVWNLISLAFCFVRGFDFNDLAGLLARGEIIGERTGLWWMFLRSVDTCLTFQTIRTLQSLKPFLWLQCLRPTHNIIVSRVQLIDVLGQLVQWLLLFYWSLDGWGLSFCFNKPSLFLFFAHVLTVNIHISAQKFKY